MRCPECGRPFPDTAPMCGNCGLSLPDALDWIEELETISPIVQDGLGDDLPEKMGNSL